MASIESVHADAVRSFESHKTRPYEYRMGQLKALKKMVMERQGELTAALMADLGKPEAECDLGEISALKIAFETFFNNLKTWMKHEQRPVWSLLLPASGEVRFEPLGVSLIIGPFNFPINCVLKPLMGAIAAGCCAVIKPSEQTPHCAAALAKFVPLYLDPACYKVVEGGVPETTRLLALRWDQITFTGSNAVGRIVAAAAAKHLTPCLLECGGKNAVFVDDKVQSLDVVARRLVWGRTFNSGQTCLAPDYVLCMEAMVVPLEKALLKALSDAFGEDPQKSPDLGRMVSAAAASRVKSYIEGSTGRVAYGGKCDVESKFVSPTIIVNPKLTDAVMTQENFGPVLSIIPVRDVDDAVSKHNQISGKHPLAFYVFSTRKRVQEELLARIRSGGATVNDVIVHAGNRNMPFGGLGASGLGCYVGRYSFEAFSHRRGVFHKYLSYNNGVCDPELRYAPSTPFKVSCLQLGIYCPDLPPLGVSTRSLFVVVGAFLAYAVYVRKQ